MNNDQPVTKIRMYLDNGASVKGFKEFHNQCHFIVSPYDHESARRNDVKWELGIHSEVQSRDCNWPWKDDTQAWKDHSASPYLHEIYRIIGRDPRNRRDGLHLDSAYKSKVDMFLTSDKREIWNNRQELENLLGFKIFHPISELDILKESFKNLKLRDQV